jgi:hypothetical protein
VCLLEVLFQELYSGSVISAAAAGAGTYSIKYSYQDANGCVGFQEQQIIVVPLPDVGIGTIPSPFCSKDPDFILTGTPAEAYFQVQALLVIQRFLGRHMLL